MKNQSQIKRKLTQAAFRHLKDEISDAMRRLPENCFHNQPTFLPDGAAEPKIPCVCIHSERAGLVCDSNYGGAEVAKQCPFWEPELDKEDIRSDFKELLNGPRGELAQEYPDLAALVWVLEDADEQDPEPFDVDLPDVTEPVTPLSRWDKMRFWISQIGIPH